MNSHQPSLYSGGADIALTCHLAFRRLQGAPAAAPPGKWHASSDDGSAQKLQFRAVIPFEGFNSWVSGAGEDQSEIRASYGREPHFLPAQATTETARVLTPRPLIPDTKRGAVAPLGTLTRVGLAGR